MSPTEDILNNAGIWTTGILGSLAALRAMWLKFSKDRIIIASDYADLDAINRLQKRIDDLDKRLCKEEVHKRKIAIFLFRAMAIITSCNCDTAEAERNKLQTEFHQLMEEINT